MFNKKPLSYSTSIKSPLTPHIIISLDIKKIYHYLVAIKGKGKI